MEGDFIKINQWLLPLSWLYGMGVRFRNMLFDMGILKSQSFALPVISVGNITVGGTGKTPHVEYLAQLLRERAHVAVLSRGYKRKTSGFLMANANTTAKDIGDEPYQMKQKFPDIVVAVDKKRVHGIEMLTKCSSEIDVVLLDDAYQHRYVQPGINILLVDYHRLIIYDRLLPAGRLREPLKGKNRADIVIVTKCPSDLKPMEFRVITKAMNLYPYQRLYFTTLEYGQLYPVFKNSGVLPPPTLFNHNILLLTGIASPRQLTEHLQQTAVSKHTRLVTLNFPDHHNFKAKDVARINEAFAALPLPRCIVTTEKDAARLVGHQGLSDEVKNSLFALPVRIRFLLEQENMFNDNIIGYIRKNSKNSILSKTKEAGKSKAANDKQPEDKPQAIVFRKSDAQTLF